MKDAESSKADSWTYFCTTKCDRGSFTTGRTGCHNTTILSDLLLKIYRPRGTTSNTCAFVSLIQYVVHMQQNNSYVRCLMVDVNLARPLTPSTMSFLYANYRP